MKGLYEKAGGRGLRFYGKARKYGQGDRHLSDIYNKRPSPVM